MNSVILIPDEGRYFHFIAEWLTALNEACLNGQSITVAYNGLYKDLVRPFARMIVSNGVSDTIPLKPLPANAIYTHQIAISGVLHKAYGLEGPHGNRTVTIVVRKNNRCWEGLDILINLFTKLRPKVDLRIASFELMSIPEQIRLMERTRVLIGTHGAGLTNAMFMKPGGTVIEINPYSFYWTGYPRLSAYAGLRHVCVEGYFDPQVMDALNSHFRKLLSGRQLCTALFLEINEHLSSCASFQGDSGLAIEFRKLIRDVAKIDADYRMIFMHCRNALETSNGETDADITRNDDDATQKRTVN